MLEIAGITKVIKIKQKMATTTILGAQEAKIKINEIEEGDIFSEQSHYVFNGRKVGTNQYQFLHLESQKVVNLDEKYVSDLLRTADQYQLEVRVGIEDKKWTKKQIEEGEKAGNWTKGEIREGDIKLRGILSIWSDIHSQQVFTVNFNKANKELSNKALEEAKTKQATEALAKIADAAKNKKGVASVAANVIKELQDNPIIPIQRGDERTLRGYKTQFESVNGVYDVIDMDIRTGMPKRQVNVRAINWLVFNGVKYIVE